MNFFIVIFLNVLKLYSFPLIASISFAILISERKFALVKCSKRQAFVVEATGTPLFGEQARIRASSNDVALQNFNEKKKKFDLR